MSERIASGRPWTELEDQLLTQAINIHGENDNWKLVALSVPGRTNKACRKRWLHSLCPSVKKSAWTREEDELLLSLYALHSIKWSVIARHIPGRTDDACSKRYREALDPALKKGDWTFEEDTQLLQAYQRLGGRWGQIGAELSRSGLGCRNRWRMLERKRAAVVQKSFPDNYYPNCCGPPPLSATWPETSMLEVWKHNHSATPLGCPEPENVEMDITRVPTPPPFQFSSSSLSAALSGPDLQRNTSNERHSSSLSPECCSPEVEPSPPPEPEPDSFTLLSQPAMCRDCSQVYSDPIESICPTPVIRPETDEEEPSADDNDLPSRSLLRPSGNSVRSTKRSRNTLNPKLSSVLTVGSDETLFAYVCGHESCWPSTSQQGSVRFATSKELWDHSKNDHQESMGGSKPFRCGLDGCGKGWKSINGLQYHLQVSKAHFRQALLNQFLASSNRQQLASEPSTGDKKPKARKLHKCPQEGCPNEYRQKSGLRYHLSHGHPNDVPAQLTNIPPALAKRMAKQLDTT